MVKIPSMVVIPIDHLQLYLRWIPARGLFKKQAYY